MRLSSAPMVTRVLGYCGLIPFVIPALLVLLQAQQAPLATEFASSYALAIICFVSGSWWGMAQASGVRATLWLSNAYLLLALLLYLFASEWWSLSAALLLLGAWLGEQSNCLFPTFATGYGRMRTILTLIAATSMGIMQLAA
jgi:hypothetical protein